MLNFFSYISITPHERIGPVTWRVDAFLVVFITSYVSYGVCISTRWYGKHYAFNNLVSRTPIVPTKHRTPAVRATVKGIIFRIKNINCGNWFSIFFKSTIIFLHSKVLEIDKDSLIRGRKKFTILDKSRITILIPALESN